MLRYIYSYYRRNLKRVAAFVFILAIGVMASGVLAAIFGSFGDTRAEIVGQTENWVEINFASSIDKGAVYDILYSKGEIRNIVEAERLDLGYSMFGIAKGSFKLYLVDQRNIPAMMAMAGVELKEGRLFDAPSREIVVSHPFLLASSLKIGQDYVETARFFSQGRYTVSGSLQGETLLAMGDPTLGHGVPTYDVILVFADREQLPALEQDLRRELAPYQEQGIWVSGPLSTANMIRDRYRGYFASILGVNIVLAAVFAAGLALFNSVEFRDRRQEIGIMHILGRSRRWLYTKLVFEMLVVVILGWVLGRFMGGVSVSYINRFIFSARGMFLKPNPASLWLSFILPLAVLVSSVGLVSRHLRGDLVGFLQGKAHEEHGVKPRAWYWVPLAEMKHSLRTRVHRAMLISMTILIASVLILGLLTSTIVASKEAAMAMFEEISVVILRETEGREHVQAMLEDIEGIDKAINAQFYNVYQDMILGEEETYIFSMTKADAHRVANALGATNVSFFNQNDILLSKPLASGMSKAIGVREVFSTGDPMSFKNRAYRVVVDSGMKGSLGLIIDDEQGLGNALVIVPEGNARVVNRELLKIAQEQHLIVDVLTVDTVQHNIAVETEFISVISSIIIYLQFFVILLIVLYTALRTAKSRDREVAIYRVIGLGKQKILRHFWLEGIFLATVSLALGAGIGYVLWRLGSGVIFSNVFVRYSLSFSVVVRMLLLPVVLIGVYVGVAIGVVYAKDPVEIIQSKN